MRKLIILLCIAFVGVQLNAREIHVSKKGNDSNNGSKASPLLTIQAAANIAQAGDVITVHKGIYREQVNPPRGGTSDSERIVYQAAPGEKVVIKGSEVVRGWKKVKGDVWTVTIPNSFFGNFNPYEILIRGDYMFENKLNQHLGRVYIDGEPLVESCNKAEFDSITNKLFWFGEVKDGSTTLLAHFPKSKNPNRQTVEINVREAVFYPSEEHINYITVKGFTLTQAACNWAPPTAEQVGLIGTHWSKGWIIENNDISFARCSGIALGKFGDKNDNIYKMDSQGWNKGVQEAVDYGWTTESIGHHQVLNNTIAYCGQTGIVGSLGAVCSVIKGNEIHDIAMEGRFGGFEIAGIKFHAAVDVVIANNFIYSTRGYGGIWLDWMAQGTWVSHNIFNDNKNYDVFVEVSHGPFLLDNNLFLSSNSSVHLVCGGGAFVQNLFCGSFSPTFTEKRSTPVLEPHSAIIRKISTVDGNDERFYNNLFVGGPGLTAFNKCDPGIFRAAGNVYLNGSEPSTLDQDVFVAKDFNPGFKLKKEADGWWIEMNVDPASIKSGKRVVVTSDLLNKTKISDARFEKPNGSLYVLDHDYLGKKRSNNPSPGPFELNENTVVKVKVWSSGKRNEN
ncbi:MAG: hypothetical protein H6Q20_2410 [Bacteroidetes bacterium]|nr:hypothetical protein [Bacteroidota bacterium]